MFWAVHFVLVKNRLLSHEADEALLWVSALISISSYSCWCNRELLSSSSLPISFCTVWYKKTNVMVSWQLCGGRTFRTTRRQNIARKLSTYLMLGAPPAPHAIYVNKGLVRKFGFGWSRAGTCVLCEAFNASDSCHVCLGCCTRPGYERNHINKVIGSQMNQKSCRRRKQWQMSLPSWGTANGAYS